MEIITTGAWVRLLLKKQYMPYFLIKLLQVVFAILALSSLLIGFHEHEKAIRISQYHTITGTIDKFTRIQALKSGAPKYEIHYYYHINNQYFDNDKISNGGNEIDELYAVIKSMPIKLQDSHMIDYSIDMDITIYYDILHPESSYLYNTSNALFTAIPIVIGLLYLSLLILFSIKYSPTEAAVQE